MAGGAEIMIYGMKLSPMPADNFVQFYQSSFSQSFSGPALSSNNEFRSQPSDGKLEYTTPSLSAILQQSSDALATTEWLTFELRTQASDANGGSQYLCETSSQCYVSFSRAFTPILHEMNPPVAYHGSLISYLIDPKSTQSIKDVDETPFVEARIGTQVVNFEDYVDSSTVLSGYGKNQVVGEVGSVEPSLNVKPSMKFRSGFAQTQDIQMNHCNFDASDCYTVRTVASIEDISASAGYTSGGQILTISGQGFTDDVSVHVDGVSCAVQSVTKEQVVCQTGSKSSASVSAPQPGAHGVRTKVYNGTSGYSLTSMSTLPYYENLYLVLESFQNMNTYYGRVMTGYFKAPASSNYKFYMSCDDACELWLSSSQDPADKTKIISVTSSKRFRDYYVSSTQVSGLQSLISGNYYYIEARQLQASGNEHISVAVEIEQSAVSQHPNAVKEVQRLQINPVNDREQTVLTISNPDSGNFNVYIYTPDNVKNGPYSISAKATATNVRDALQAYYQSQGGYITVTLVMTDSNGAVTTDVTQSVSSVYTIFFQRATNTLTSSRILMVGVGTTTATASIDLPSSHPSSPPLTGAYTINCVNIDGTTNNTAEIPVGSYPNTIQSAITNACPSLRDKIEVWDGTTYNYYTDGRDFYITFSGVTVDLAQFQIQSGTTNVLAGGSSLSTSSTTTVAKTTNIFYAPIPYDYLFTDEQLPQVTVITKGLAAVCSGLACSYQYQVATSQITAFSYSGNVLTITGTSLPTSIIDINFGLQVCTITSQSTIQIQCSISGSLVSGSWLPLVREANGYVPTASSVSAQTVSISASSLTPNSNLNPNGGTTLTISGNNFPHSLDDGSTVTLTFADSTKCTLLSATATSITCQTKKFQTSSLGASKTLTITINGQTSSTLSAAISATSATVASISPATHSPVLKAFLTLTLSSVYTGAYSTSDFQVSLVSTTDPTYIKLLNVVSVDSSARQIKVKYGGALSGMYNVRVHSLSYGDFDSSAITFEAKGTITSYTPNTGSLYGGTIVTINGLTYSDDATDNPVLIGSTPCDIITSSSTQIICRTQARLSGQEGSDTVLVFLKTSEEAVCQASNSCSFTWTSTSIPDLASFASSFNTATNKYQVTFTGTGFDGTNSQVALNIDGHQQQINSVSSTQVVTTITNIDDLTSTDIQFYLLSGTPSNSDQLSTTGLSLTPQLVSISPNIGSPAGSIIIANVQGVGINTKNVNLVTSSGTALCSQVTVLSYGLVQCTTTATSITSATQLKVKVGSTSYSCANTDQTQCQYSTSSSAPSVTSVAISSDHTQIIFTGINFPISTYAAEATFSGILSNSATVDSSTQVTATFTYGIPVSSTPIIPALFFNKTGTNTGNFASNTQTLTNAFSLTSSSSALSCSFAGGCQLQVVSNGGLTTSIKQQQAKITVCGRECILDESTSLAGTTQCNVPALPTIYSNSQFAISQNSFLSGTTTFSSNSAKTAALFDMNNVNGYIDTGSTCNFGMGFTVGHVGIINQVKFFMNVFTKANYVDNLIFQGSQDGVSYSNLFTVSDEIHEGWNYYDQDAGKEFMYRFYRFFGKAAGACNVGEFSLRGVEAVNSTTSSYTCSSQVEFGTQTFALTTTVNYLNTKTPSLTSLNPRFGTVTGGTPVTFTGTNFPSDTSLYSIIIDNRVCSVTAATSTSVTCTTQNRPGLFPNPSLKFSISGYGNVATRGLLFRYVSLWSDTTTWGGEFAPVDGESVDIPKGLNLLVDVDSTAKLNLVLVEGSLIFPPNDLNANHVRTFDATYVLVKGGYMEIGTEQFPYTSKLIITMHGEKTTPEMPIYGNKVIGVRDGVLEMHGVPRVPTWTELYSTVNPGDQQITLNTDVDWKAGETIVIAPTSYDCFEAEKVDIVSVDRTVPSRPVIHISKQLAFKHYAGVEYFGSEKLEMRAEVALLTRNVVYRGDPETSSKNQFGAHIMLHSHGDESLAGRIEYIELTDVGQAYQLGRYPLHFHRIGTVSNSYIRGNAIYNTYNRAVTIHDVKYLRVIRNIAYNTMGHTFFIEDAVETKNFLDGNLAIQTKRSWSLLNTDQTPASFWITNPDNMFRNNHAAGSERYGFWFDLQPHSTGPSFDINVCPINTKLGEFINNTAHSNGRYGLRIFHGMNPRENPCLPVVYDPSTPLNPFWQNPLTTANFTNFLGYKNKVNGAIVEKVGDVRFTNFKVSDNLECGIEFSLTGETGDQRAQINGALVVGHSANADQETLESQSYGVITARSENFTVSNVKFYNFDQDGMTAIGTCSHCAHPASTDSGARTVTFSGLYFDSTVNKKVKYQFPYRDILRDTDGTLTGLGPNTWATPYWKHNEQPECQKNLLVYDGLLCNSKVQVRRITFQDSNPQKMFQGMEIKILQYDNDIIQAMDQATHDDYLVDGDNYSIAPFKPLRNPNDAWAMPYVTGHKYKIHWRAGLDFMGMSIVLSERWRKNDLGVEFLFNFTDVRAAIDVVTPAGNVSNGTLISVAPSNLASGDNNLWNDTNNRTFQLMLNGLNYKRNPIKLVAYRCIGPCMAAINETAIEDTPRYWSNVASWGTLGRLPLEGEDVEIKSGWNMILDLEDTPVFKVIQINGRLSFLDDGVTPITLNAKHIFVRAGQLLIGNETNPYTSQANVVLYGLKNESHIVYTNAIEAGNKLIANTGTMKMFGQPRSSKITRLTKTAKFGDSSIFVETGLDWKAGDKIGLTPSSVVFNDSDYGVITNYNSVTGQVDLDRALTAINHYGAASSTASQYNGVDIRGEVFLLSRNIIIKGQDVESWGCQIVTSDFIEADETERNGHTVLDNVEVYNCSQYDTYKAAMRFQGAVNKWSSVTNSAIYFGNGWGVHITSASNILFKNNVVFGFMNMGGVVDMASNVTIDNNLIGNIKARAVILVDELVDPICALAVCAYVSGSKCSNIHIINNIVAGSEMLGYAVPGHNCNDKTDTTFSNNVVHSVKGVGAAVFPVPANTDHFACYEGSNIAAYKVAGAGVFSYYKTQRVQFTNLTLIDNNWGVVANIGIEGDKLESVLKDSFIYGETESRDCFYQNQCKKNWTLPGCVNKKGVLVPEFTTNGKDIFPKSSSAMPFWKIKTEASWGGASQISNVQFINFQSNTTFCGTEQSVFETNHYGADYHPRLQVKNSRFTNVHQDAVVFLFSPPIAWAVIDDCGIFPCTGPKNALIDFQGISYSGTISPNSNKANFQIISNNLGVSNAVVGKSCKFYNSWNGYYCESDNLGMLIFESVDGDFLKRTFSPMIINNALTGFNNTLNEFMDHTWDGFYTGQIRQSRFPSLIETGYAYNVTYTGTPPGGQRYKLVSENGGVTIHIKYTKPGAYQISDLNSNVIQGNSWDDTVKNLGLIKGQKCGENRYLGVDNILEFYLTPNCMVNISPIDQILTRVRLNWTLDAFYADGGATKFVDRLASSLGIHASTIKVVSVYQGSVQVVFQVININKEDNFIANVKSNLTKGFKTGSIFLGAQILEYQQNLGSIVTLANITVTAPTSSQSTSSGNQVVIDKDGKTIIQVQNTNTSNSTGTKTNTNIDDSSKNSNLVKILLISIIIFAVFIISVVVGFLIYRRYYNKKMQNMHQINSDSPDEKKEKKNIDNIEEYNSKGNKSSKGKGGVISNIFNRRPSSNNHEIVVQNIESQGNDNNNDEPNKNTYSQVSQNFNTSSLENNGLINNSSINNSQQPLSNSQKITMFNNTFRQRNVQVHSELSINSHGPEHMVPSMVSPSKGSFIIHNELENADMKIKTPSPKKTRTEPGQPKTVFGNFQTQE